MMHLDLGRNLGAIIMHEAIIRGDTWQNFHHIKILAQLHMKIGNWEPEF